MERECTNIKKFEKHKYTLESIHRIRANYGSKRYRKNLDEWEGVVGFKNQKKCLRLL